MIGYFASAVAYVLLLGACLTVWRRRLAGSGIALACGAQLGWSLLLTAQGAGVPVGALATAAAEYLRDLAWALVLVRSLSGSGDQPAVRWTQRLVPALALSVVVVAALILLSGGQRASAHFIERYWFWGGFVLCIGGLVLVEQVARNTRAAHRWSLKHIWLAVGALYAWDLCLYSVAMLHGQAAAQFWAVRGFVNAALGALLAVGLRRVSGWQSAAFLSPRVLFFNATLLGASLYVLAMAAASYFVREYGGSWGEAGQLLFLAAGALVLAVAVLSDQFRAWARVTFAKYLFPYRYDYRTEWQKLTRALSVGSEKPVYERIVGVMAGFVSCAAGGLWLRDADGHYAAAGGELAPPDAPREREGAEFFAHLLEREWICDLDAARNPVRGQSAPPPPPAWMLRNVRLWLVVPLICEGSLIGFVVLGQPLAAMRLTWEEIDLLRAAGRQVASFLAFEQAAKRLAEAHQFEAMNRLSAVLMHDLRHLIAQLALVVQNAARHRGNPEFIDDAILTIENSVKRMTRLMEELRRGVLTEQAHRVELAELCAEALRRCAGRTPVPLLEVRDRGVEVMLERERLLQVLEHVIRNAQEATPSEGSVSVRVRAEADRAIIEVIDTGAGMDAEFVRTRLFKPFETTKEGRGFGIGAYDAREFVRKCGGAVEVESTPGKGTRFVISLPAAPALAPAETEGRAHRELQAH